MHRKYSEVDMRIENQPIHNSAQDAGALRDDKELEQALKNIHEKYGNDFQAFLRDITESLRKQRAVADANEPDACFL